MLIKFVQYEAHAVHKAVHVRWFAFRIRRTAMGSEGSLKQFKILHPFKRKVVRLNVGFIEYKNEWQLRFVEDAGTSVKSASTPKKCIRRRTRILKVEGGQLKTDWKKTRYWHEHRTTHPRGV